MRIVTDFILAIGDIPIPDFPVRESVASPGFVSLALGGATILTILYFSYYYFSFGIIRHPELSILRRSIFLTTLTCLCLFATVMSVESDKKAEHAAFETHDKQMEEVSTQVYSQIEEKYDTVLEFRNVIPNVPTATYTASDYIEFTVTRPDVAGQPCYLAAPGGYYTIRCGGDSFDTSTDLPLN